MCLLYLWLAVIWRCTEVLTQQIVSYVKDANAEWDAFLLGVPQHLNNLDFFKYNVRHITIKKIPLWLWVPSMIKTELNAWKRLNIIDCIWLHYSKVSIQLRLKLHTHIERVGWHGMHPYWNSKMIALTLTAKQKCTKIIIKP